MPLTSKKMAFAEFKAGKLHSGKGGALVTDRKQAIAIALAADRRMKDKGRHKAASGR